ncbi:hypothetical protein BXZ70DRAFT_1010104 [Cristinia sonorae]|uniref:FAD-binding domain-containing protein n=1 Tax=Cristinia sonorae TaxID=1940300 RepID=A0A8K0UKI3_9AGAR|nr:hypothetical protein BXZ70DRAFT_1010104 [Cristinia sonorae]
MVTLTDEDIWKHAHRPGKHANLKIDCLVLGGGLTGLATAIAMRRSGHNVTVVERDPRTQQLKTGGGCRLPPNVTKILFRWGLGERLLKHGRQLHVLDMYEFDTGDYMGIHEFPRAIMKEAGGDYILIQYGDVWQILYDFAKVMGAEILTGVEVTSIDPDNASITIANGDVLTADLLIGADGPYGMGRQILLEQDEEDERLPKSFMIYETMIPAKRIDQHPDARELRGMMKSNDVMLLFGTGAAWHFFPVSNGEQYTVHYTVVDDGSRGMWSSTDSPRTPFSKVIGPSGSTIRKLAEIAEPARIVRAPDNHKLDSWVHENGRFVVVGEAAHPLPPAAQQAIAMCLEDGAVLGKLFSHLNSHSQIPNFLYAFEELRQGRCYGSYTDEMAFFQFLTMPHGPDREARDTAMKTAHAQGRAGLAEGGEMAAQQWAEVAAMYAYDCEDEADEWWVRWGLLRQRAAERQQAHEASDR